MASDLISRFSSRRAKGFTLIEVLIVLVIAAILTTMAALIVRAITVGQKRSLTASRISGVDAALTQFVILQRRLPCPADGTLPSTHAAAGGETARDATGCTAQQNGVVPWRALGLAEQDVMDGWERRLTYRVSPLLSVDAGMNMSACDPAGAETAAGPRICTASCTSANLAACTPPLIFLATKGLTIKNVSGTSVMEPPATGAAYVVISHGESGGGGYLNSGTLSTSSSTDGTEEQRNYADKVVQTYYVDDSLNETAGATHFDDILSRPTVLSVVTKAGLGPRSH
jgi:prepilin-type N-terminal cleavage/methylation domain-containing protein